MVSWGPPTDDEWRQVGSRGPKVRGFHQGSNWRFCARKGTILTGDNDQPHELIGGVILSTVSPLPHQDPTGGDMSGHQSRPARTNKHLVHTEAAPAEEQREIEDLNYYLFAKRVITEPSRTKAIQLLDKKRREYLKHHPIPAKLHGREAPNKRGRPPVISGQSLAIFLALDSGAVSRADILRALGRDPSVDGRNVSAQYRWINLRFEAGRETFLSRSPEEQSENRERIRAISAARFLEILPSIPSK